MTDLNYKLSCIVRGAKLPELLSILGQAGITRIITDILQPKPSDSAQTTTPPKHASEQPALSRLPRFRGTSARTLILKFIADEGKINMADLQAFGELHGMAENTVAARLCDLSNQGLLTSTGISKRRLFELTEAGKAAAAALPKLEPQGAPQEPVSGEAPIVAPENGAPAQPPLEGQQTTNGANGHASILDAEAQRLGLQPGWADKMLANAPPAEAPKPNGKPPKRHPRFGPVRRHEHKIAAKVNASVRAFRTANVETKTEPKTIGGLLLKFANEVGRPFSTDDAVRAVSAKRATNAKIMGVYLSKAVQDGALARLTKKGAHPARYAARSLQLN